MGDVFRKVTDGIDIGPMVAALYEHHAIWDQIKARQETPGSPHSETKTIFLRWSKDFTVDAAFNQVAAVNYPALKEFPEADDLINTFNGILRPTEIGRVIITSLKPGGRISPHIDEGNYPDHFQRFHLPLSSNILSTFYGKVLISEKMKSYLTESVCMKPGELWWFDNKKEHWVENLGTSPRVHMIFDAVVPGWERDYDRANRSVDADNIVGDSA